MKRALIGLGISLLLLFATAATPVQDDTAAGQAQPAVRGGHLQQGGAEIGRGYGQGGQEMGRGAAGFGENAFRGQFGEAGRSLGAGGAGFGKGVGVGTARGFKKFGLAFRNLGRKLDRAVSN